ncbi:ATP-binding cassette domain-containing protein [Synechococcus sp. UW140]|uniref:ATP-binding cassette domain-containing protein n=1 Tax=Synechococcus sp. UW140 TaxID=368503 RepID=UPI003137DE07
MTDLFSIQENRIIAIKQAQKLSTQINFERLDDPSSNNIIRLVGFALNKLKCRYINLTPCEGEITKFLDFNDLLYRTVRLSSKNEIKKNEHIMLIVKDTRDNCFKLTYQEKRRDYVYCAETDSIEEYRNTNYSFEDTAIELYPSMPAEINTPWQVLSFSFSKEIAALMALVIASAAVMLFNLSIPVFTDMLIKYMLPSQNINYIVDSLGVIILIILGSIVSQYLQQAMLLRLETTTDIRLQTAVWDRLLRLPISFFNRYTVGDLASRVNAISALRQLLGAGALSTIISTLFASSYFILMYQYNVTLSNWALLITVIGFTFVFYAASSQVKCQFPLQESEAEATNFALQSLIGVAQIRSSGTEPFIFLQWMEKVSSYALNKIKSNIYNDSLQIYTQTIIPLSTAIIFTVAVLNIINEQNLIQNISSIIAFNTAFLAFNSKLNEAVLQISTIYAQGVVLWKRAEPIFYAQVESGYKPGALRVNLEGNIHFRNISFKYPTAKNQLFKELSFNVIKSAHTALTGKSGSGKTTIFRLLLSFLEPDSGDIFIDNYPLKLLAIRTYRKQIGVVLQNSQLNPGSIYDCVSAGLAYTEDQVWHALEAAQIADEVNDMQMKLDTVISQGASNISGGQRQRLAIARAFISNPTILLMDEATSALDNKTQKKISEYINSLGITRITIAHRLSTIREADQNIIIESGIARSATIRELSDNLELLN